MSSVIDAVITWVDGRDPIHEEKIKKYKNIHESERTIASSMEKRRFSNNGEIFYCINSIIEYMPWIRNIFLVTDSQIPDFIISNQSTYQKVKIIDHTIIFKGYEQYLPTFNSISIESMLQNIPGLSENYIYFNDDFIVLSEISPDEFFLNDNVVLKGKWKKIKNYNNWQMKLIDVVNIALAKAFKINRSMSLLQQMRAAELAGFSKKYFWSPHYPHPQIKSSIVNFYNKNRPTLMENIKYKFRNINQHVAIFLSMHLEIMKGNAVLRQDQDCMMICFNRDIPYIRSRKIDAIKKTKTIKFLCIQNFEDATAKERQAVITALNYRLFTNNPPETGQSFVNYNKPTY